MPVVEPKSKGGFSLGDYVEVKDRIRLFYEAFPSGAIVTEAAWVSVDDDVPRIWVRAAAYRAPDDSHPGIGHSWMVLPGTTTYTRGSELENTETSAWGRAIGATGIALDKSVASADEVRNKQRPPGEYETPPERPELVRTTHDDGLVGIAELGKAKGKDADGNPKGPPADTQFELRQEAARGHVIGFRLTQGKKGYKVLAFGPLAEALAMQNIIGERVTCWGTMHDESFTNDDDRTITYQVLHLERISTPDFILHELHEAAPEPIWPDEPDEAERAAILEAELAEAAR
jgi:hypothetical protein